MIFESRHREKNVHPRIHAIGQPKKKTWKIINIITLDLLLLLFYVQCNNGERETTCRSV